MATSFSPQVLVHDLFVTRSNSSERTLIEVPAIKLAPLWSYMHFPPMFFYVIFFVQFLQRMMCPRTLRGNSYIATLSCSSIWCLLCMPSCWFCPLLRLLLMDFFFARISAADCVLQVMLTQDCFMELGNRRAQIFICWPFIFFGYSILQV
jgi:hypothetical protein